MKKIVLAVLILVAGGAAFYFLDRPADFGYVGTIETTKVDLPARVASVISARKVSEGDGIKQGQSLVTLAVEDYKLAFEIADKDFERGQKLVRTGSMPEEAFEHLRNKRDNAALQWDWCDVKSPLNGIVLNTYKESGEWVTPGTKLMTIADLSQVWAMIYVPETLLSKLSLGMPLKATLTDAKNRSFEGKITHINDEAEFTPKNVQTAEEHTRLVFGVKVTFNNPDSFLKPGMAVQVDIPEKAR